MNLRRSLFLALVVGAAFALTSCGKSSQLTSPSSSLDTAPPAAPAGLVSDYVSELGYDYLYWTASASASVNGYEVWESQTASGTATKVASVGGSVNNVVLPSVTSDCTLYYQVRARSANGKFSALSAILPVARHALAVTGGQGTQTPGNPDAGRIGD